MGLELRWEPCVPRVTSAAEELDLSVLAWKCMGLLWVGPHPRPHTHTPQAPELGSHDWKQWQMRVTYFEGKSMFLSQRRHLSNI